MTMQQISLGLRSFVFNVLFFVWTGISSLLAAIGTLVRGQIGTQYAAWIWGYGTKYLLSWIVGLTCEFQGKENLPKTPFIMACKHQSAWETAMIQLMAFNVAVILKKELFLVPLFGQVLWASGAIGLNRRKGRGLIEQLVTGARKQRDRGRSIFIFPEGTRSAPGKPGKYKMGVAALYKNLELPVVPVALNSGYFWPRRGFIKYPGHIVVKILKPIQPGLSDSQLLETLEHTIENHCKKLPIRENA